MILTAAALLAFLPKIGGLAQAASDAPHIIAADGVWLLDSTSGDRLFLLPNSYYARIDDLDDTYYHVTFNGVQGKVLRNSVSTTGYHTIAPGTTASIGIDPSYSEFAGIYLKALPATSAQNVISVPVESAITFIGEYPQEDGSWYYVQYNGSYGYIKASRTTMPKLSIAAFVPEKNVAETSAQSDMDKEKSSGILEGIGDKELKIIIIIGLAIPAALIVILLFLPRKGKEQRDKYYENE